MNPEQKGTSQRQTQRAGPESGTSTRTKDVQGEADEAVVRGQRGQDAADEDNVLKVKEHALAVEKVHGRRQPVPVEGLDVLDAAGATGHARNVDDLLERHHLDHGYYEDDVDVAQEQRREEAPNHDERPKGARYKICLFLLVLGQLLLCRSGRHLERRRAGQHRSPWWSRGLGGGLPLGSHRESPESDPWSAIGHPPR